MSSAACLRASIRVSVAGVLIALAPIALAQLRRVNALSIGPQRHSWTLLDPSGRFEQEVLAVTRSGDLLIFSAKSDGRWGLYRVRGWERLEAQLQHLILPGYFSIGQRHNLETLAAEVFVTPDDQYAVCVATAEWLKRVRGRAAGHATTDNMISVVDLSSFTIVGSTRTKGLDLYEFQGVTMDKAGRLVIHSLAPGKERKSAFIPLEIPSLRPGQRCAYSYLPVKPGEPDHPVTLTSASCAQDLRSTSLEDYLNPRRPEFAFRFGCKNVRPGYCPEPTIFSHDRRFGVGVRFEGHDSLLGSWVQTGATAIVFSMKTHAEIGEMDLMHGDPKLQMASLGTQDYLLVLRHGYELTVYEVTYPSQHKEP